MNPRRFAGLPHPARVRARGVSASAHVVAVHAGPRTRRTRKARAAGAVVDGDLRERRAPRAGGGAARDQGVHVRARGRRREPGALADAVGLRPEVPRFHEHARP